MRSSHEASLYLYSDNPALAQVVEKYLKNLALKVETKKKEDTDYRLLLITFNQHENQTARLTDLLEDHRGYPGKICLVICADSQSNQQAESDVRLIINTALKELPLNLRVVVAYDLYDAETAPLSSFQAWLCQSIAANKLIVSATGKNLYFPTAVEDLCQLIIKSLFINNTAGESFTAAAETITDLELGYLLKESFTKRDLTLDLDLTGESSNSKSEIQDAGIQTQALLNWLPKITLADQVDSLLDHCLDQPDQSSDSSEDRLDIPLANKAAVSQTSGSNLNRLRPAFPAVTKISPPSLLTRLRQKFTRRKANSASSTMADEKLRQNEKSSFYKLVKIIIIISLLLVVLPFILTVTTLYLGANDTYQAYQHIRVGESDQSRRLLNRARTLTAIANRSFQSTTGLLSLVSPNQVTSTTNFISILGHGQEVLASVLDAYALGNELYQSLTTGQAVDQKAVVAALRVNLITLSEKLSQIQLLIGKLELPIGLAGKIESGPLNQQITLLKSQITLGLPLLDLLGAVVTSQVPQHYLVLIQDQNELRPSGGFIASYVLITLDQGKITSLVTDSSLSIDRLIEGRIEPPALVKSLLGSQNWLFHDSNLDADFAQSANQVVWFFERFKGIKPAGVIGVNLSLFRFLLEEIGPLSLPTGQTVTAANINELARNPTSSRGIDTITALTQDLVKKIETGQLKFALLARSLLKTITYNEISLWFRDPGLQAVSQEAKLTGALTAAPCHPQLAAVNCRPDTLYLNEANFSVNKLNFYLKRQQTIQAEITPSGLVNYTLIYDYSYPVPAPTNLTTDYKAHYQLYLPQGATNLVVSLDNQPLDSSSLTQTTLPFFIKLAFSASQAVNQSHRLVIRFTSPFSLDLTKPQTAYALSYLKQPGTLADQLTLRLLFPENLQPRLMTLPLKQVSPTELVYEVSPPSSENLGVLFRNAAL